MLLNCRTADDVLKSIKDNGVQMVDLRFTDLPGTWQHFSVPPGAVDADALSDGIGFDGSSIRGFQEIQESDMLVVPDPTTAFLDPFAAETTLALICNIRDPVTGQSYSRDPRYIAQKAEIYERYQRTGIEQERLGLFPRVLWSVPHERRKAQLVSALGLRSSTTWRLHQVVLEDEIPTIFNP